MLDAIAQWTCQVHWIILKPLKPIIALPQTKNNQIHVLWEKNQKPNSLTILIFVPPVLMHQMIYRLFSFWVISTPQELEMIIVFLTESPYLDYTLFLFFCVSWRTYLYANSDPRSHNSNPNDYTSSLESALKLPFL